MIEINPNARPNYLVIGDEKIPVVVIDDYVRTTEEINAYAVTKGEFKPDGITSYPGVRSTLPKSYVVAILSPLMKGLYDIFSIPQHLTPAPRDNYFSLITVKEEALTPIQTMPHFDSTEPNLIAVMHYLSDGEHGGTGFFKDKKTGQSTVELHSKGIFYQLVEQYIEDSKNNHGRSGYCTGDNDFFSCYEKIAYKPNRLVIFPGKLLHSSLVDVANDINDDPSTGRLTANMFIDFV